VTEETVGLGPPYEAVDAFMCDDEENFSARAVPDCDDEEIFFVIAARSRAAAAFCSGDAPSRCGISHQSFVVAVESFVIAHKSSVISPWSFGVGEIFSVIGVRNCASGEIFFVIAQ
jgi:hypothetical protein